MDDCHSAPAATQPPPNASKQHIVAIVGPPNSGKSNRRELAGEFSGNVSEEARTESQRSRTGILAGFSALPSLGGLG